MALNLWKLGGKPTSYNPLPSSVSIQLRTGVSYVITFKAKSASGATLQLSSYWVVNDLNKNIPLTPDYQTYSVTWNETENGLFYLTDLNNKGDIIIDSIELVQKPLPKLTINGIGGEVGDWTVNDAVSLKLANNDIPCLPNTTYILNVTNGYKIGFDERDANKGFVVFNGEVAQRTFTTRSNTYFLRPFLYKGNRENITLSDLNSTKITLNLGSIPAPYSKKTGEKMVLPVAKKNLVSTDISTWEQGTILSDNSNQIDTTRLRQKYDLPLKRNTDYTISLNSSSYQFYYRAFDAGNVQISSSSGWENVKLSFNSGNATKIRLLVKRVDSAIIQVSEITNLTLQLEQSTYPTAYEPYAVQVNKKPQRYVPKKNLFDGRLLDGTWAGTANSLSGYLRSADKIKVNPNASYKIIGEDNQVKTFDNIHFYDVLGIELATSTRVYSTGSFTTPSNAYFVTFHVAKTSYNYMGTIGLFEGTTQTPYEPYQLILPRAKTGIAFNGVTDYLQLPSMTMDSIEIDCLIDAVQGSGNPFLFDARNGSQAWIFNVSIGTDVNSVLVNGSAIPLNWASIPKGSRMKLKANFNKMITDDVSIFADVNGGASSRMKGTLYKVTCYLSGQIVATYDFEKPSNIVGDKVLQNAKNLIPSFEDKAWSLHANAKPLGKDVLRIDATSYNQNCSVDLNVSGGTNYLYCGTTLHPRGYYYYYFLDANNSIISETNNNYGQTGFLKKIITTPLNCVKIRIELRTDASGSFDFIKPQLYQLDGKEGTIVGTPKQLNKAPKSNRYNKR